MAKMYGLVVLKNVSVDFNFYDSLLNIMSEEKCKAWMALSD